METGQAIILSALLLILLCNSVISLLENRPKKVQKHLPRGKRVSGSKHLGQVAH